MTKRFAMLILIVVAASLLMASPVLAKGAGGPVQVFKATFTPINASGVTGVATLQVKNGNVVTVHMVVRGLEPRMVHMQSITGKTNGKAIVPPVTADTNHDGFISWPEGTPYFGSVLLPLTPYPELARRVHGAVVYDVTFSRFQAAALDLANVSLDKRAIVLQGDKAVPSYTVPFYWANLPVAVGVIKKVN